MLSTLEGAWRRLRIDIEGFRVESRGTRDPQSRTLTRRVALWVQAFMNRNLWVVLTHFRSFKLGTGNPLQKIGSARISPRTQFVAHFSKRSSIHIFEFRKTDLIPVFPLSQFIRPQRPHTTIYTCRTLWSHAHAPFNQIPSTLHPSRNSAVSDVVLLYTRSHPKPRSPSPPSFPSAQSTAAAQTLPPIQTSASVVPTQAPAMV